jgi:anhydro-N-acetylmuramic acid kinase
MTGTSLDGLDAAVIRADGHGLGLRDIRVVGWASRPLPETGLLASLSRGEPARAGDIARVAQALGAEHARACGQALGADLSERGAPAVACVHGQTVFHHPPLSWQLINPWPIARALGCPVVFDLRGCDLEGGGEGAPITPIADWVLFRSERESRVIVNLGGFCNITSLPRFGGLEAIRAFDVCACNQVLDHASRVSIGKPFDPDGSHALGGRVCEPAAEALARLLQTQNDAGSPQRSLGTGDEANGWVRDWAARLGPGDLLASACAAIGRTIARRIQQAAPGTDTIALSGGSVANRALVRAIEEACPSPVVTTADLTDPFGGRAGIEPGQREAACFAVLGLLLLDGVEITLTGVTGRSGPIPLSGAWISKSPNPGPDPTTGGISRPTEGTF